MVVSCHNKGNKTKQNKAKQKPILGWGAQPDEKERNTGELRHEYGWKLEWSRGGRRKDGSLLAKL